MFDVYCPGHEGRVLLGPSAIEALLNTPQGILLHWRCYCGTKGTLLTGSAATDPAPAAEADADRTRVFNYLQCETPQQLVNMQQSEEFRDVAQHIVALIEFDPHQCDVLHVADAATVRTD